MIFTRCRALLEKENIDHLISDIDAIQGRMIDAEGCIDYQGNTIRHYLTAAAEKQLAAGTLSKEKAMEKAEKKCRAVYAASRAKTLEFLTAAENVGELTEIKISVEWHNSRTWGANPFATVLAFTGPLTGRAFGGSASGCGYDKLSAAVAEAFNQSPAIMGAMYSAMEKNPDTEKRDIFGYGCGYGVLPSFEGGVGISCFASMFEKIGYTWQNVGSGKMFDVYHVTKNNGGK